LSLARRGVPKGVQPFIVGIAGRAQAGKSTYAEALVDAAGGRVVAMADSVRDIAEVAFGGRFETQEQKSARVPFWAERIGEEWATGRRILQRVGTELFREHVHPDFWLYHLELRLERLGPQPLIAIPDLRFPNEAGWVRAHGGVVVLVERLGQPPPSDAHASERGLPAEAIDERFASPSAAATVAAARALLASRRPELLRGDDRRPR
jgi:hypothetical protein